MNLVAHAAVAAAQPGGDDLAYRVGAAAPDLSGRARVVLTVSEPVAAAGVVCHRRTDEVFHHLPWFTGQCRQLADELGQAGLRRGPSRAVAHVGVELLLDGVLVGDPAVRSMALELWGVLGACPDWLVDFVAADQQARWRRHVTRFAAYVDPQRYAEPIWVAGLTHAMVEHRPRLAFPDDQVAVVAGVLEAARPAVAAEAFAVVDQVAAAVAGPAGPAGR